MKNHKPRPPPGVMSHVAGHLGLRDITSLASASRAMRSEMRDPQFSRIQNPGSTPGSYFNFFSQENRPRATGVILTSVNPDGTPASHMYDASSLFHWAQHAQFADRQKRGLSTHPDVWGPTAPLTGHRLSDADMSRIQSAASNARPDDDPLKRKLAEIINHLKHVPLNVNATGSMDSNSNDDAEGGVTTRHVALDGRDKYVIMVTENIAAGVHTLFVFRNGYAKTLAPESRGRRFVYLVGRVKYNPLRHAFLAMRGVESMARVRAAFLDAGARELH